MDESIFYHTSLCLTRAREYIYILINVLRVLRGEDDDDDERLPLDLFHRRRCRFCDCDCSFCRSKLSAHYDHQFSPSFERDDDDDDDDDDDEGGSGGGGG